MHLSIHNYEILNFHFKDLATSENGVSKTTTPSLTTALSAMKNNNTRHISKKELLETLTQYGLNPETTFDNTAPP